MSAVELYIPHLTQEELSPKDKGILSESAKWVVNAKFDPKINVCADRTLVEKRAAMCEMDIIKKFPNPIFQIRRVSTSYPKGFDPGNTEKIDNVHSMMALRVIEGQPTVQGINAADGKQVVLPFCVGWTTYIRDNVAVTPSVDILFIASKLR